jgi:hypothetical protein
LWIARTDLSGRRCGPNPEDAVVLLDVDGAVVGEILAMPEAIARGRESFGGRHYHTG